MLLPLDPGYFKPYSMVNVFADDKQASGVYAALWAEVNSSPLHYILSGCTKARSIIMQSVKMKAGGFFLRVALKEVVMKCKIIFISVI